MISIFESTDPKIPLLDSEIYHSFIYNVSVRLNVEKEEKETRDDEAEEEDLWDMPDEDDEMDLSVGEVLYI